MKEERRGRLWSRLLLALYPPSFRRRYGRDLEEFMRRQRSEPRYRRPALGSLRYGWDVTLDGIGGALEAWRVQTSRRETKGHETRDERRRTMGMGALAMCVRTALKILARNPRFTATVVLTLGLGLGASTAVYSLANWLLLRPVPGVADPDRVVTVRFQHETRPGGWFLVSHPDLAELRSGTPALEALGATHETAAHAVLGGPEGLPRRLEWWGGNNEFRYDRVVTVWVLPGIDNEFWGTIGISEPDAVAQGDYAALGFESVSFAVSEDRRTMMVGVPARDLDPDGRMRLIGTVGTNMFWSDELVNRGSVRLRLARRPPRTW